MKKVLISILSILFLLSSFFVFVSYKDTTTPPPENLELSTVELTTDNISTYLACNVEYSEYRDCRTAKVRSLCPLFRRYCIPPNL